MTRPAASTDTPRDYQEVLQQRRGQFLDVILYAGAALAVPATIASIFRSSHSQMAALGYLHIVECVILVLTAAFARRLPYKVRAVHLDLTPTDSKPGGVVEYTIGLDVADAKPGDHVVRLEVHGPTGELNLAYTRNILTTAGRTAGRVCLALDDEPGVWRFNVIDTISGRTNEARLRVWPGPRLR